MDNLTQAQRRKNMQNIRSSGTKPERLIMRELKRRGLYFSANVKSIEGKPDVVFRRKRVAVFIDSDFWHGHKTRLIMPKNNASYWNEKIARNKARDMAVNRVLRSEGWKVVRVWEYDVKKKLNRSVNKIMQALEDR